MGAARGYRYAGPALLAERARPGPDVIVVTAMDVLARWLAGRPLDELSEPVTFVVGLDGRLRLAPRRSEHVDCAAGQPVLAAGEVLFVRDTAGWMVSEISNQSAGYCPDLDSWPAVAMALDRAGVAHPGDFHAQGRLPAVPGLRPAQHRAGRQFRLRGMRQRFAGGLEHQPCLNPQTVTAAVPVPAPVSMQP